jgi:hypothetical protein
MVLIGLAKDFKLKQVMNKTIYLSVGCLLSAFSLFNSRKSQFGDSSYSQSEMDSYLRNWDSHRSDDLSYNWKAFLLFLIAFGVLQIIASSRPLLESNLIFVVKGIQVLNVISVLAYSYHVFGAQRLHQNIFMQAQVGRLQLAIGYLLTPLIFGVLVSRISSEKQIVLPWFWRKVPSIKSTTIKKFTQICAMLAIITVLNNLNDISKKNSTEFNSSSRSIDCDTNMLGEDSLVLASQSTTIPIFRICELPIILDATSFDFIPYLPQTLMGVKRIIESGYGLDFDSPANNINCGCIPEVLHRNIWESRTEQEWLSIARELKFSAIAAPAEWNIDVPGSVDVLPGIKLYVLPR